MCGGLASFIPPIRPFYILRNVSTTGICVAAVPLNPGSALYDIQSYSILTCSRPWFAVHDMRSSPLIEKTASLHLLCTIPLEYIALYSEVSLYLRMSTTKTLRAIDIVNVVK